MSLRPPHLKKSTFEIALGNAISAAPLGLQYVLRDYYFRGIADTSVTITAIISALLQPNVSIAFLKLQRRITVHWYGETKRQYVEVFTIPENPTGPIVMFVHGGAWGSGAPWMYRLAAQGLGEALGASAVVLVGYGVYPDSTIPAQIESVRRARRFIHQYRCNLGLSPDASIILSGHSSGANLCALVALDGSPLCAGLVLLSGVFDITRHYLFESDRGVQNISPMYAAAGSSYSGMVRHSPLSRYKGDPLLAAAQCRTVPPCLLVHYTDDDTVPFTSSIDFANVLRKRGASVTTAFPVGNHVDPILDLMKPVTTVFRKVSPSPTMRDTQVCNLMRTFSNRLQVGENGGGWQKQDQRDLPFQSRL